MLGIEEDRNMWMRLFEDCDKEQGEEIEGLRQEKIEQTQRLGLATIEQSIHERNVPRWQFPIEFLTPRNLGRTAEVQTPTAVGRVTITDPIDILGDPVVETTMQQLVEANRSIPGSGCCTPWNNQ